MSNCDYVDPFVTPYVDGELAAHDCAAVERHLQACDPCRARVTAERSVRNLLHRHKAELRQVEAPSGLRARIQAPRPQPKVVLFPRPAAAAATSASAGSASATSA